MRHVRPAAAAVSALLGLLVAGVAPARAEWSFAIPAGWADLSPGKPVPKGVPAEVAEQTQSGQYHTYAMDVAGRKDGFASNLNVIVAPGSLVASPQVLDQIAAGLPAQAAREVPGSTVTVVEKSIVDVAGVPSLRIVADLKTRTLTLRILKYAVPGGDHVALITYSTTPKAYAGYLPVFEAAVQQTKGAAAAPVAAQLGAKLRGLAGDKVSAEDWQKIFGFGGKVVGALVAIVLVSAFTRRKKRASAQGAESAGRLEGDSR